MANRLLIGAALGVVAATVYQKAKATKPPAGTSRVADLASKANERVDAVAEGAEAKVDAVEQAVGEGIKLAAGVAHRFIGSTQERAEGVGANVKRAASDYAKRQAKDQLGKQASRLFERIVGEAQQVVKQAQDAVQTPTPAAQQAPTPQAAKVQPEEVVSAMVRLEVERWVRDHRGAGALGFNVDDERREIVLFMASDSDGTVPSEILGYKTRLEHVRGAG